MHQHLMRNLVDGVCHVSSLPQRAGTRLRWRHSAPSPTEDCLPKPPAEHELQIYGYPAAHASTSVPVPVMVMSPESSAGTILVMPAGSLEPHATTERRPVFQTSAVVTT